jgi:hypothetical protein
MVPSTINGGRGTRVATRARQLNGVWKAEVGMVQGTFAARWNSVFGSERSDGNSNA